MGKFLSDFFPIILFFISFKLYGIFIATAVVIVVTGIQAAYMLVRDGEIGRMFLISLGVVVVFGGATILFHNELFIKWKPSIAYWLFAVVLWSSHTFFKKNLIKSALSSQTILPESVWNKLNMSWILFFVFVGALNLYVAYKFSTDAWVNFKLFGLLGLMFLFVIAQSIFMWRHMEEDHTAQ